MRPPARGPRPPRGAARRALAGIAAGGLLAGIAIGFGMDHWPSATRTPPAADPPPASARVTCEAMPRALAGAFGDAADCTLIERTLREAVAGAEPGTITRWTNTRSRTAGTIKLSGAESRDGAVCRRAELAVTRSGETKHADAVLCLKQGTWVLVE